MTTIKKRRHFNMPPQLLENALMKVQPPLSGYDHKVLTYIIDQTLGWKDGETGEPRRMCRVSPSQIKKATGIDRRNIRKSIQRLLKRHILRGGLQVKPNPKNPEGRLYEWHLRVEHPYLWDYEHVIDTEFNGSNPEPIQPHLVQVAPGEFEVYGVPAEDWEAFQKWLLGDVGEYLMRPAKDRHGMGEDKEGCFYFDDIDEQNEKGQK